MAWLACGVKEEKCLTEPWASHEAVMLSGGGVSVYGLCGPSSVLSCHRRPFLWWSFFVGVAVFSDGAPSTRIIVLVFRSLYAQ